MEFKRYGDFCLCSLGGAFPQEATPCQLFSPLVFLVDREPQHHRGWFGIRSVDEIFEEETAAVLTPRQKQQGDLEELRDFVEEWGATVLNTAFSRCFSFLTAPKTAKKMTLVGLGDVGGTLLTALKLLDSSIEEIAVYDPNEAQCKRYEAELNQVLGRGSPRITIARKEELFSCDVFLFTASRGVPAVGQQVQDVRLVQYALNRDMLKVYARQAREAGFMGLFCQISDPVDQLSRVVFLESNRNEAGVFDGKGLLPEQIQGFGLGVMAARAAYYGGREGIDFSHGCAFGPHGKDLIVANDPLNYDPALSERLTELTVQANLEVRSYGFKPYIAPALSSAALSILPLLRGEVHYGAVPIGGAYLGCRSSFSKQGLLIEKQPLHEQLLSRIETVRKKLEDFDYD